MPRRPLKGTKMIHVGVSMPLGMWETAQHLGQVRHVSASAILRDALTEYLERRGLLRGPKPPPALLATEAEAV